MGCSPPVWWLEQQDRLHIAQARREHEERVARMLRDIEQMTPEQKERFKAALEGEAI
jgi:hypothetical protein